MAEFGAADYGSKICEILSLADHGHRLMPLVASGCISEKARRMVHTLSREELFDGRPVSSVEFADAARSGLFLYVSCLEDCHAIAQEIGSTTGSYWHGIMHRQEPDFSNAGYWFHRVKNHEVFPALQQASLEILKDNPAPFARQLRSESTWNPFRFIELCQVVYHSPDPAMEQSLKEIQRAEWQLLFEYCCWRALQSSS